MPHVDDGQLNALLDGELTPDEARSVQEHLAVCAECARRLEEARVFLAEAGELLTALSPGLVVPPVAASPASTAPPPVATTLPGSPADGDPPIVAPLARGPGASGSTRKERVSEPAIAKTSKEIAVSIDGRTAMTPAIRPVRRGEVPAAPKRPWQLPDLEKLAWAASLILCVGVGYLANEVYHLKTERQTLAALPAAAPAEAALSQPAASGAARRSGTATPTADLSSSRQVALRPPARREPERAEGAAARADEGRIAAGAPSVKPSGRGATKPAPPFAQRPHDELAATIPTPTPSPPSPGVETRAAAPAPALAPAQHAPAVGAAPLADAASADASRNALGAAGAASAPRFRNAQEEAPPVSRLAATASLRRISLEEAVRLLSGSIRLIDGMQPSRVEAANGTQVPGADPARDVVRVTYTDAHGSRLVLEQQVGDVHTGSFAGLMQGDTLVTTTETGGTRVRWVDRKFWLSLTGNASVDSLRSLTARVR